MELFEKRESLFDVIISFPVSFRLLKTKLHRTCTRTKNPNKLTLIRFFPPLAWFLSMEIVGRWKYILLVKG